QRLVGPGTKAGGTTSFFPISLPVGAGGGAGAMGETNPVDPRRICAMRSVRLNLWVLAPEIEISNIEVSCSAVGLRAASKNEGGNGSSGSTDGSGFGTSMSMGGLGFGVGLGVVAVT